MQLNCVSTFSGKDHNVVKENTTSKQDYNLGGGIYVRSNEGTINLSKNVVKQNSAASSGPGWVSYSYLGGGIYARNDRGDIILSENTITNNNAPDGSGGGAFLESGVAGDITLNGNTITNNYAANGSGGLGISSYSSLGNVIFSNNVIANNSASGPYYGTGGGASIYGTSNVILFNNIITGNTMGSSSNDYGGGLSIDANKLFLINNTITGNSGGDGGGVYLYTDGGAVDIYNNIIWNNMAYSGIGDDIYLDSSDAFGGTFNAYNNNFDPSKVSGDPFTNEGSNLNLDPLFVDLASGNYHLSQNSPLINMGNNSAPYLPDTDFEGDSRIADGVVDIGADEYMVVSDISVSPVYLNFGNISAGTSSQKTITVTNNGATDLYISSVTTPSAPFIITDNCSGQTLPSSISCTITVDFSPSTEGVFTDTLTISSTDTGNPNVIVYMSGTAITTIKGTVTDSSSGAALYFVTVTVTDSLSNTHTDITDSKGAYSISGFASGNFTATFEKYGYTTHAESGIISAGYTLLLDIQLAPLTPPPPVTITIMSPADGAVLSSSPVTVTGVVTSTAGTGGGNYEALAQSFIPETSGLLTSVILGLDKIGNPDDNIHVRLTTELGGEPMAVSNAIAPPDFTSSFVLFDFPNPPAVTVGNTYYIELWREKRDVSNYVEWDHINGLFMSPPVEYYSGGKAYSRGNNVWSENCTYCDFVFEIYINDIPDVWQYYYALDFPPPPLIGFTPYPVNVTVNGTSATVSNNTFSASVPLNEGQNTITATATDTNNNSATNSVDVTLITEGSIAGTVTDLSTGLPLSSATVSVTDSLNIQQTILTDTNGTYTINDIASGAFSGSITKSGYSTYNFSGTMSPGQTITINAALIPTPPTISNIVISNITNNSATITWTTDQPSDSLVEYGETSLYGSSQYDPAMTTSHSVTLTGLTMGTKYHFRVTSTNALNASSTSSDNTFTTYSPITLTITSPLEGETINRPDVMVRGTVNNSTGNETGVTVNGIVATVYGNQFIVNHVPLEEGTNTITANATDTVGNTATTSITVNAVTTMPHVTLNANIESGIPPLTTYFSVSTSIPNAVSTYQMDYEGNGTIDYTGTTFDNISFTYTTEGIYYPTVIVTDSQGIQYSDTIAIVVLNLTELDALLRAKWEAMKTALANQDVDGATAIFLSSSQERYQYIFSSLLNQLPSIAANMNAIEMIYVEEGIAQYRIKRTEDVREVTYYIYFTVDENGIWRIKQF